MEIQNLPPATPFRAEAAKALRGSSYPQAYQPFVNERIKRQIGDIAGINQFGVNLVHLPSGAWSSQRHWHTTEDEFIYILSGELMLITEAGEKVMKPGDCAGFKAGNPNGHHLINKTLTTGTYLEIGTRMDDGVTDYPDIDMKNIKIKGQVSYVNRKGEPY